MGYETDEIVSVGTWFGLTLLIGLVTIIPLVGLPIAIIILLIMAFTDLNKNIKNWAKASLIWYVIALVIGLFIGFSLVSQISGVSINDMYHHLMSLI